MGCPGLCPDGEASSPVSMPYMPVADVQATEAALKGLAGRTADRDLLAPSMAMTRDGVRP